MCSIVESFFALFRKLWLALLDQENFWWPDVLNLGFLEDSASFGFVCPCRLFHGVESSSCTVGTCRILKRISMQISRNKRRLLALAKGFGSLAAVWVLVRLWCPTRAQRLCWAFCKHYHRPGLQLRRQLLFHHLGSPWSWSCVRWSAYIWSSPRPYIRSVLIWKRWLRQIVKVWFLSMSKLW